MGYIVNQFNQPAIGLSDPASLDNLVYMTQLTEGTAKRRISTVSDIFFDECVQTTLVKNENYYFHSKIKKLSTEQVFDIYLVDYAMDDTRTQYLKTITVDTATTTGEYYDFHIVFSPLIDFNCILFELKRIDADYNPATRRYPVIVYEELSRINNMIDSKIGAGIRLVKIGIQSRPGMINSINSEEIHVGRTGIYEIKNGIITIDTLSMINTAIEDSNGTNPIRNPETGQIMTLGDYLFYLATLTDVTTLGNTNSSCIFANSKLRAIESFTLDYMYKEEEE
jgi:hypothetical protein